MTTYGAEGPLRAKTSRHRRGQPSALLGHRRLRVQHRLQRLRQARCLAQSPVVQEQNARFFPRHVLVDRDDVDALLTHGFQHRLKLALGHREIAVDNSFIVSAGERGPGIDAHFIADRHAMHGSRCDR